LYPTSRSDAVNRSETASRVVPGRILERRKNRIRSSLDSAGRSRLDVEAEAAGTR